MPNTVKIVEPPHDLVPIIWPFKGSHQVKIGTQAWTSWWPFHIYSSPPTAQPTSSSTASRYPSTVQSASQNTASRYSATFLHPLFQGTHQQLSLFLHLLLQGNHHAITQPASSSTASRYSPTAQPISSSTALQRQKTKISKQLFPEKGISGSQSQFPHSCVCERFIYSHDRSAYSAGGNV